MIVFIDKCRECFPPLLRDTLKLVSGHPGITNIVVT